MADAALMNRTTHAAPRLGPLATGSAVDYLGPATVVDASRADLVIDVAGRRAVARPAFSSPYEPADRDVLLVIGGPGGYYAIGVLDGAGRTSLRVHGDVDVHAVGGSLRLSGDKGVEIQGDAIELRAGKLNVLAGAAVQKFTTLYQRVSEMLSVRAGARHTVIDGDSMEKAKSATLLTEETVSINGKQVHLG